MAKCCGVSISDTLGKYGCPNCCGDEMPTLGELLKQARDKSGLNQKDVADATGISQGNISDYERDKGNPTVATLQKLCQAYGTTVSKLTKGLE